MLFCAGIEWDDITNAYQFPNSWLDKTMKAKKNSLENSYGPKRMFYSPDTKFVKERYCIFAQIALRWPKFLQGKVSSTFNPNDSSCNGFSTVCSDLLHLVSTSNDMAKSTTIHTFLKRWEANIFYFDETNMTQRGREHLKGTVDPRKLFSKLNITSQPSLTTVNVIPEISTSSKCSYKTT